MISRGKFRYLRKLVQQAADNTLTAADRKRRVERTVKAFVRMYGYRR